MTDAPSEPVRNADPEYPDPEAPTRPLGPGRKDPPLVSWDPSKPWDVTRTWEPRREGDG